MLAATGRNNSISHVNDIEALRRKNKDQNSSETTCVLFPQKTPHPLTITSNPFLSQIIMVIYITAPEKDQTSSVHSYTAHTMGNKQSCL